MKTLMLVTAIWCAPCHKVEPMVMEWAASHPDVRIERLDFDKDAARLAQYHLGGVPNLIDGERVYSPNMLHLWNPRHIEEWFNEQTKAAADLPGS